MTTDTPNSASAAAQTGSGDIIDCWAAIGTSDKRPAQKYQAQNLVRPDRARPLASFAFHEGRRA
jgi:hypothetical protein